MGTSQSVRALSTEYGMGPNRLDVLRLKWVCVPVSWSPGNGMTYGDQLVKTQTTE